MIDHLLSGGILIVISFLAGSLLVGAIARVKLSADKRHGCSLAAMRLQRYLGNPAIHATMHAQFRAGHRFDTDKEFRELLEETLRQAFDVGARR